MALNFWLNSANANACCFETDWNGNPVVNGGNGDPLGCVAQSFLNTINNNFIPNSPNWPGQGCNWLQNALNNAQTQLANNPNWTPGTGPYCKLMGKINFIQNLMQTGQSTYINGSVSFTPPC